MNKYFRGNLYLIQCTAFYNHIDKLIPFNYKSINMTSTTFILSNVLIIRNGNIYIVTNYFMNG